jgi:hypothetical protein
MLRIINYHIQLYDLTDLQVSVSYNENILGVDTAYH